MNSITLDKIIEEIKLDIITGSINDAKKIDINCRGINKGGLELTGYSFDKDKDKIIIFGRKETAFIKDSKAEDIKKVLKKIFKEQISAITFASNVEVPKIVIEAAKECGAVITKSKFGYTDTGFQIAKFLTKQLSTTDNMHATFLQIYGKGVIITGESGIGKSETALELIKNGHQFIVDDGLIIRRIGNELFGESPDNIKNLIEVRGLGIMDITKIFSESIILDTAKIDYIFNLKQYSKDADFDRLGQRNEKKEILGINVPVINIPVALARNTSMLIEVAVTNEIVKSNGHCSLRLYLERTKNAG